jgi:hypothetical protein
MSVSFQAILSAVTLQSCWIPGRTGLVDNMFMTRTVGSCRTDPHPSKWGWLPHDEASPWSRSNHVLGTRLLPSSDDSTSLELSMNKDWHNSQPGPTRPLKHTCDWDCVCIPLTPALSICLFEAKAHVCTPKMAEEQLSAYSDCKI